MTLLRGNNGEMRQGGWRILEIEDWHYRDALLRAEYVGEFTAPDDENAPIQVQLRNGDQVVVGGWYYVHGEICQCHNVARLCMLPAVVLGANLKLLPMDDQDR